MIRHRTGVLAWSEKRYTFNHQQSRLQQSDSDSDNGKYTCSKSSTITSSRMNFSGYAGRDYRCSRMLTNACRLVEVSVFGLGLA